MKVWVTPLGQEALPAEVLVAKGTDWAVGKGGYKPQPWPRDLPDLDRNTSVCVCVFTQSQGFVHFIT